MREVSYNGTTSFDLNAVSGLNIHLGCVDDEDLMTAIAMSLGTGETTICNASTVHLHFLSLLCSPIPVPHDAA